MSILFDRVLHTIPNDLGPHRILAKSTHNCAGSIRISCRVIPVQVFALWRICAMDGLYLDLAQQSPQIRCCLSRMAEDVLPTLHWYKRIIDLLSQWIDKND
jgi:hypothetical protein